MNIIQIYSYPITFVSFPSSVGGEKKKQSTRELNITGWVYWHFLHLLYIDKTHQLAYRQSGKC